MNPSPLVLACLGVALLATLALAAHATPRTWWHRPNLQALAVLVLGTAALGNALWWLVAPDDGLPVPAAQPLRASVETTGRGAPLPGRRYRVADALNLRAAGGVHASRVIVLAPGALVTATGRRDGDWWQVAAEVDGRPLEGWASSLWLRRADERGH